MVLPKPIYENLPYLYFLISGALLAYGKSWHFIFSASIFYIVACVVLVTRSAHRRLDKTPHLKTKHVIPELIYEYLPYCYGAIGIFILMSTVQPILQFIAFALFVLAFRNLMCRRANRSKGKTLF
ncbi:hypothetical protein [Thalassotalea sp. G2M2-11]|uniref:hypothetical protein n=1 Tax=Thalassotalea sp. G2M2-11 TaxID=2787627 RepID=UPI0019D1435E|nr:hypothetical protein [Thalassotalea sp. G2M2-11]